MAILSSAFALLALAPVLGSGTGATLTTDVSQLVVGTGGTQTFALDAGVAHASELYLLLGSTTGTAPGQAAGAHVLALNLDAYFLHTLLRPNGAPMGSSFGVLSPASPGPGGTATATFTLPPGLGSSVIGLTVHHAFVALDLTGGVTMASNAVLVDLVASPTPSGTVQIPAGRFVMGDHHGLGGTDELPLHTVALDSFHMDAYETTNKEYRDYLNSAYAQGLIEVTGGVVYKAGGGQPYCNTDSSNATSRIVWNGSTFAVETGKLDHPMCDVSWYGAVAFANWRSTQEGLAPCYDLSIWHCNFSANGYRLPTEAEWEYAARGGQHNPYTAYPWGDLIDGSHANFWPSGDPYEAGENPWTTPVGYYDGGQSPSGVDMANGYGLYDMAGNTWEWCEDWYSAGYYGASSGSNPHGPPSGLARVKRGGSWNFNDYHSRCASRSYVFPDTRAHYLDFRLVRAAAK